MNRKEVFEWVMEAYGTEPDYPWKDSNAVLRHKHNKKWYGVILEVSYKKLGFDESGRELGTNEDEVTDVLNVKCDPMMIGSLRQQPGYFPAYHMNKEKWISILLDGTVPQENIKSLLEMSFELTK
ncbi:MmcQ/YjbR family DNA-binding protein [Faecalicatena sp. AGMB00832]|uniref:MmcQ/YjbR family DNA-binding protein n=1 Tax=Faecalicatena faecalis TaxID=2726362 RepID=A0ABS6D647_9FIRM|nr:MULTISPECIES: MmcQ/YjbR family DNA-binding protein [Faecalicatena]MBU3877072.1 MmcQ/YjbR family DNA-binding protein [Faecalicatena faecalis]MCI6467077.1 MmcQ/YjbR family DNA-binding protein [Faecalicatena sp.]MDY5618861.1 MmcQ/YjbR family DNA-binding protein [Lachnospiraceae bacterium]